MKQFKIYSDNPSCFQATLNLKVSGEIFFCNRWRSTSHTQKTESADHQNESQEVAFEKKVQTYT